MGGSWGIEAPTSSALCVAAPPVCTQLAVSMPRPLRLSVPRSFFSRAFFARTLVHIRGSPYPQGPGPTRAARPQSGGRARPAPECPACAPPAAAAAASAPPPPAAKAAAVWLTSPRPKCCAITVKPSGASLNSVKNRSCRHTTQRSSRQASLRLHILRMQDYTCCP